MKANRLLLLLALAGLPMMLAALSRWPAAKAPSAYHTETIDEGPIERTVLAMGSLHPAQMVTVGTPFSGTVLERHADFNDRVRRGQVLLRLDPAQPRARLRQALAQVASAAASLELARATLARNEALLKQGFISALALLQSQRELDVAQAAHELAAAQADAARAELASSVITSPIDGVVLRRNVDAGQTVAASFQTPDLFVIAHDLRQMHIHAQVHEADVVGIEAGMPARFTVDAYPDTEFHGRVLQLRLGAQPQGGSVSYTAVIGVENTEERLKPGMTALARIVKARREQALRVPKAALRFQPGPDGLSRVWTVAPGWQLEAHTVKLGLESEEHAELLAGTTLRAGDPLVVRRVDAP